MVDSKTKTNKKEPKKTPRKKKDASTHVPSKKRVTKSTAPKKSTTKKVAVKKKETEKVSDNKPHKYYESVGRRKRAVARVRLFTKGDRGFFINAKPYIEYFSTTELQEIAGAALKKMKVEDKFRVSVIVRGGGLSAQAEAVRHGISRALLKFNPDFRKRLKRAGFLKRDPREKERRKFGLKKARKAPQWSKR